VLRALRLFLKRRHCDGVVTGEFPCSMVFAWLQALVPWGRRPHVMVDCNWYLPAGRLARWLRARQIRVAARSVRRFVVWASHEVDDYASALGVERSRLQYVPFHHTLDDHTFEVRDEGYVFAGGNYDRDYPTLVEAVRGLPVPVWIATTRPEQLRGVPVPDNVRVQGTTPAGFRQAMAGARLVVVPMQDGLLHSGGQQTCLNAMMMGKPTIAVGRRWAVDFISKGDGLIVDYGDVDGLRRAVRWVLENPEAAAAMGRRGRERAAGFTTRRCMETIYRLAAA
jgi:glycosyltransferase involved in cell wall biosynthesis